MLTPLNLVRAPLLGGHHGISWFTLPPLNTLDHGLTTDRLVKVALGADVVDYFFILHYDAF